MEMCCVFSEARAEFLNNIWMSIVFKGLTQPYRRMFIGAGSGDTGLHAFSRNYLYPYTRFSGQ
jgi:hypothetical protein